MNHELLIWIDESDVSLRCRNEAIRVEREGKLLRNLPLNATATIVITANAQLESNVLRLCAEKGVNVAFLPTRFRKAHVSLAGVGTLSPGLRAAQHKLADQPEETLALAKKIIWYKLEIYRQLLARENEVGPLSDTLAQRQMQLGSAKHPDEVRGLEGQAARLWFGWLATRIDPRWQFGERNRRPPKDPVNAVLSLGYRFLETELGNLVRLRGLDTTRGYLHALYPGRESLVYDLLELYRPLYDHWLVTQWLPDAPQSAFASATEAEGCRLAKSGWPLFMQGWNDWRIGVHAVDDTRHLLGFGLPIHADNCSLRDLMQRTVDGFASLLLAQANLSLPATATESEVNHV